MRICSLLPGATEIACALGLADEIVGVSHECDFPAAARSKPVMVRSRIDPERSSKSGSVKNFSRSTASLVRAVYRFNIMGELRRFENSRNIEVRQQSRRRTI
jgi:iron complex transport system substrate-binding protein